MSGRRTGGHDVVANEEHIRWRERQQEQEAVGQHVGLPPTGAQLVTSRQFRLYIPVRFGGVQVRLEAAQTEGVIIEGASTGHCHSPQRVLKMH